MKHKEENEMKDLETCVIWDGRDEPRSITPHDITSHDKAREGIAWM
jgi:hypothetical protein